MAKDKGAEVNLQAMINEQRDRKKAQATADKIFGKTNAPASSKKASGANGSLSSRAGVNKKLAPSSKGAKPGTLAARIAGRGGAPPTAPRAHLRAAHDAQTLADALLGQSQKKLSRPQPDQSKQLEQRSHFNQPNNSNKPKKSSDRNTNIPRKEGLQVGGTAVRAVPRPMTGLTIKGLAGPHVVEVQGFAPGTTAADVEQASRHKGVGVYGCRLLQSSPTVNVDVYCDTKEDADRIREVFHNIETDYDARTGISYILTVHRPRSVSGLDGAHSQRPHDNGILVDGSMGFEPMAVDDRGSGNLYSDQLVGSSSNRRGRGFQTGRGSYRY
ncbi:hypothetical protein BD289DRAFT_96586 [Coniella lustricola]|uniref:RRM domain-containing protein n=1 Tax=Coniella lustricola TaxID=2025994 RepID=A0A2T3AMV4_9PEZI|nr:hypothetical protein BD289DRAFT_96586 [Coniella lustricola]